ncbi:MmgE/PrpD family protein [Burkholderia sp. MSMB2157WGS]|uniref:MmgE/PrpD family protein n=1 Tax=Burkholderia sp. MSMB2157WGS TaxID=1637928 RepID=UPI0007520E45|nr:MmgE/PrpD family protein [Burkholderia sp. MSMB2157WGS]KWE52966.1 2-methylcitrate dehydratase [Burkholderia sp. MSMB2157WGS]
MNRRTFLAALGAAAARPAVAQVAPATPTLAHRLADYAAALNWEALDATTIETAKAHVIDALGCALVAHDAPPVAMCRRIATTAAGPATLVGTRRRSTPELAAFANGAAIRYEDLNDLYVGAEPGHPSDNVAPCLAVAEAERASGRDLLLAIVLAYEVDCRLLDAANITSRGWDHPVYSLPAVALAAGKLMRLDRGRMEHAVNLSLSGHLAMNQTRVQQLSDWKGLADASASRDGVFSAQLAREGVTGPAPIFEGRAGLFQQVSGPFALDVSSFGGPQRPFRIDACAIKPYPAQGYTLTAIAAAIDLATQIGDPARIRAIHIDTTHMGYVTAGRDPEKWRPETRETADHSLPYIVARALLDHDITRDSYAPAALHDPAGRALMAVTTVSEDARLTAMQPNAIPNRLTVTLDDGRKLERQVDTLPGFPGQPTSRPDTERKFQHNVAGRLSDKRARHALDALWALDARTDLDGLLALLAVESRS